MSSKFHMYISCPISIPEKTLDKYVQAASKLGVRVSYWSRGTIYCETPNITSCDAFVLILPEEQFKCSLSKLPAGCRSELTTAMTHHKNIFLGYTTAEGYVRFYTTNVTQGEIRGQGGSTSLLIREIDAYKSKVKPSLMEFLSNPCSEVIRTSFRPQSSSQVKPVFITVPRI